MFPRRCRLPNRYLPRCKAPHRRRHFRFVRGKGSSQNFRCIGPPAKNNLRHRFADKPSANPHSRRRLHIGRFRCRPRHRCNFHLESAICNFQSRDRTSLPKRRNNRWEARNNSWASHRRKFRWSNIGSTACSGRRRSLGTRNPRCLHNPPFRRRHRPHHRNNRLRFRLERTCRPVDSCLRRRARAPRQ